MTYEDSVSKLSRTSFSPQKWISSPHNYNSDYSTAPGTSNHKTQYQLSYYNSRPKINVTQSGSPQRYGTNDPYYSAHKTAAKFFRTIEHSPILGAKDRSKSYLPSRPPSPIRVFDRSQSKVQLRIQDEQRYREKLPFDSNIEHSLKYVERVVRQKNY